MVANSEKRPVQLDLSLFEIEVFISVLTRMKDRLRRYNEFVEHADELGIEPDELAESYQLLDEVRKEWAEDSTTKEEEFGRRHNG